MSTTVEATNIEGLETEAAELELAAENLTDAAAELRAQAAERRDRIEAYLQEQRVELPVAFRDLAMKVDTFTEAEFCEQLGISSMQFKRQAKAYIDGGRLVRTQRAHGSYVYAWLAPEAGNEPRHREATPESLVAAASHRGATVAGTGKGKKLSPRRHVQDLVDAAVKAGAVASKQGDGHIAIVKDGKRVGMSSTPRKSGMSRTKKELRDLGIAV